MSDPIVTDKSGMAYVRLVSPINNSACRHDYTTVIRQTRFQEVAVGAAFIHMQINTT